ncbi:MAG: hypothetical protein HY064_12740 [Bacteroidetes bacterium]|nr:hypothetical protein [Bacteroidota bacterium]
MKKILLSLLLPSLFFSLSAQNVNDDVLHLQKSNASLKSQLKEQQALLSEQTRKTDSIFSLLQSASGEIKKNTDSQNSITHSISDLKEQTKNSSQITSNISDAFGKRRTAAIIGLLVSAVIALLFLFYLKKKLSAVNNGMKQNEENFNQKFSQINQFLDKEIGELRSLQEKQNNENNARLTKQTADTNENINKLSKEVNKKIESEIQSLKGIVQEQHSQSAREFSEKISELNQTVEKKIAAIKNELDANKGK